MQKYNFAGHPVGMSLDVLLECPRTSFRDVLGVNVTESLDFPPPKIPKHTLFAALILFSFMLQKTAPASDFKATMRKSSFERKIS